MALYAIDGTWSERRHQSNVYEFARRYRCPFVGNARYYAGPGTPTMRIFGAGLGPAMTGTGSRRIVNMVVEQIAKDRARNMNLPIDLIGFSRGAAIANEVAAVLSSKGILRERTEDSTITEIPSVRFMGLFDPVHSMGFPIPYFKDAAWGVDAYIFTGNHKWCADKIPANVKSSYVLYARDDPRPEFHPTLLRRREPARGFIHDRDDLYGDHSDLGGHIENNRWIARIALRMMITKARSMGVPVADWGLITPVEERDAARKKLLTPSQHLRHGAKRPFY